MGAYVFDNGGCFEVGVVTRGPVTLRDSLDLCFGVVEGQGVDGFNGRNSWSSLASHFLARRKGRFKNAMGWHPSYHQ
jgi:hypothetical protein